MYQRDDTDFGPDFRPFVGASGASALAAPAFGSGAAGWSPARPGSRRPPAPFPRFDLVVNLGADIGSPHWLRGLATLGAMLAALVHVTPGPVPLPGASPAALAPAGEDEMRAIGIAPAAYGADSGRRIAPTARAEPLTSTPERPQIDLVATLGPGDGFVRLLEREGASATDAATAAAL